MQFWLTQTEFMPYLNFVMTLIVKDEVTRALKKQNGLFSELCNNFLCTSSYKLLWEVTFVQTWSCPPPPLLNKATMFKDGMQIIFMPSITSSEDCYLRLGMRAHLSRGCDHLSLLIGQGLSSVCRVLLTWVVQPRVSWWKKMTFTRTEHKESWCTM